MATFIGTFVLVLVCVSYSYQEPVSEEAVKKARNDCQKETKVAEEIIEKAENGEFSDDSDFKCFVKCFYTNLGYVNEAGEPLVDAIKANIPEAEREKAGKVLEKCMGSKKEDACENAFELHKCYFGEIGKELESV